MSIAVLNVDSLDGKSDEDMAAGKLTHVVCYSTEEGRRLAEFMLACAARYDLGLDVQVVFKERVNDDDGKGTIDWDQFRAVYHGLHYTGHLLLEVDLKHSEFKEPAAFLSRARECADRLLCSRAGKAE